jgi:hypothetical protein
MIELILVLVVIGVCLYLIESFIPMDPAIKTVIRVLVVLCLVLYLLRVFGILDFPVPRLRS